MHVRTSRGVSLAIAAGLLMSGSAALAADTSPAGPDVEVTWKAGTPFPQGATRLDVSSVDIYRGDKTAAAKQVYVLGFRLADNSTDGSIWVYDVKKKTWTDTGDDMAVPVSNYTIVPLEDKTGIGLYTFGGRTNDGETSTVVQVYYPDTGQTQVIDSDPWPGTTLSDCVSLPGTGAVGVGNKAYLLGGMSFSTSIPPCVDDVSDEVWSFNPKAKNGKKWKSEPKLSQARGYISPTVDGKTIYAIGGDTNEAGSLVAQTTVEAWKVGAKKWNDAKYADLPVGCDESQAFAFGSGPLDGTITLAGCGQWPAAIADVYQYDIADDSWDQVGSLLEARRNHGGTNIGTAAKPQLMVVGGYSADGAATLATVEIGTPGAGAFVGSPSNAPAGSDARVPAF